MRAVALVLTFVAFCHAQDPPVPVVLWHAMGDSCCNPLTMGPIIDTIKQVIDIAFQTFTDFKNTGMNRKLMDTSCH